MTDGWTTDLEKGEAKILRGHVDGKEKYCRIPIRRRIFTEVLALQANDERRGVYPLSIETLTDLILEELGKRGMVAEVETEGGNDGGATT
jgi:hypothetical protein